MSNERPYVNHLSGDTLPGYSNLKQFLTNAVGEDNGLSSDRFWASLRQGLMDGDVDVIENFHSCLSGVGSKIVKGDEGILYFSNEVGVYRCGPWKDDVSEGRGPVIIDVSLDFLDNPEIVTKNVTARARWYLNDNCSQETSRDFDRSLIEGNVEYFSELLERLGVKGGIGSRKIQDKYKDDTPRDGVEYSVSIEVPPYTGKDVRGVKGGIHCRPGENLLDRIENPDFSHLDQLVNAMHLSVDMLKQLNREQE